MFDFYLTHQGWAYELALLGTILQLPLLKKVSNRYHRRRSLASCSSKSMSAWSMPCTAAWRCQWVNAMSRQKWSLDHWFGDYLKPFVEVTVSDQTSKNKMFNTTARHRQDVNWRFLLPFWQTTNMSSLWKPLWKLTPIRETGSASPSPCSKLWRFWNWPLSLDRDCIVVIQADLICISESYIYIYMYIYIYVYICIYMRERDMCVYIHTWYLYIQINLYDILIWEWIHYTHSYVWLVKNIWAHVGYKEIKMLCELGCKESQLPDSLVWAYMRFVATVGSSFPQDPRVHFEASIPR